MDVVGGVPGPGCNINTIQQFCIPEKQWILSSNDKDDVGAVMSMDMN